MTRPAIVCVHQIDSIVQVADWIILILALGHPLRSAKWSGEACRVSDQVFSRVDGCGPPVLFLPGLGWTAESGWPFLELCERYTLHRLDLPGLGRSAPLALNVSWTGLAQWVQSYCDRNEWKTVRIIGHGLGGIVALAFADFYPERVHQLVLLDSGYQKIPVFPESVGKPRRYFTPLLSAWSRAGGGRAVGWLSRRGQGDPLSGPEALERELNAFAEEQSLALPPSMELRQAFEAARREVRLTDGGVALLLAVYRSKPLTSFCRLKPATLLIVPESAPQEFPLSAVDELNLPILLYEVSGGHYVHFCHPETAGTVGDFFDHWN